MIKVREKDRSRGGEKTVLRQGVNFDAVSYNRSNERQGGVKMRRAAKALGGAILLFIGVSILLSMFGIHLGGLIGLVLGAWLMYLGYTKWQETGWSPSSIVLLALGAVILFGGMGGVVSLAIGLLLVYFGYKLVVQKTEQEDEEDEDNYGSDYDSLDAEFDRLIKK